MAYGNDIYLGRVGFVFIIRLLRNRNKYNDDDSELEMKLMHPGKG